VMDGGTQNGGVKSGVAESCGVCGVCGVGPRPYPRATDPPWQGGKTGGETADTHPAKPRKPANIFFSHPTVDGRPYHGDW
jgi:hypothetical protein